MNGTGRHKHLKFKQHKENYTRTGDIMATDEVKVRSHSDNEQGGWGMFSWPHLGGTEAKTILGTWWGKQTATCLWKTKKQQLIFKNKLGKKTYQLCTFMFQWLEMSLGLDLGGNGSLDQMLTGRKRVCGVGGLKQSGSVVGDRWDSENEPRGRRLFGSGEQISC